MTPLEITLIAAIGGLAGAVGVLWRKGIKEREALLAVVEAQRAETARVNADRLAIATRAVKDAARQLRETERLASEVTAALRENTATLAAHQGDDE